MNWINVLDRLPDKEIQVLVYGPEIENIHGDIFPYKTAVFDGESWRSDHFCESTFVTATHWMPLPDAPTESEI